MAKNTLLDPGQHTVDRNEPKWSESKQAYRHRFSVRLRDGKVTIRPVEIATFREDGAAIASGLKTGEMVILTGQRRLADGQAVQAQPATPPERRIT